MSEGPRFRKAALRGGAYLAGRQLASLCLKFIGVMLITRVLGPASYGAYVSGINIYNYALALGTAGVGVYLLRHEGVLPELSYRTSYAMLLTLGLALLVSIELGVDLLARWTHVAGFAPVMRVLCLALLPQLLAMPASVRLERQLDYKSIAINEILGQAAFYVLAVPLVLLNFGPVSLAAAWVLQQTVTCLAAHLASRSHPRFAFHAATARQILHYAAEFSLANWIWQIRMLINPLIVGPVLGAGAVGIIGMTNGLLEMLTTIRQIAWRLSVAILAKFKSDRDRLRAAVTEGMELQVMANGVLLVAFAWTGQFIVPRLFGERWLGVMEICPYIAVSYLTIATFNIHSATLSVLNLNRGLALHQFVSVTAFALVAALAVPKLGIVGYGLGELATLPTYLVMHLVLTRAIGSPDYRLAALWWLGAAIGLFVWQFGAWAIALPFLVLLTPRSTRKLQQYLRQGFA